MGTAIALTTRQTASTLSVPEQKRFLKVVQQMNTAPTTPTLYAQFVAIHADMSHQMHSMGGMSAVGRQRFLPWHRDFLLKFEQAMQQIDLGAFIPYWKWSEDRTIPQWIAQLNLTVIVPAVGLTAPTIVNVTRHPHHLNSLPTQQQITTLEGDTAMNYTQFTSVLEGYHNNVHSLVGGTMNDIMISPCDPLFWMHHAEVDRIWSIWQADPANKNKVPALSPISEILDPWAPDTTATVADIGTLGYRYA